ncbi:Predicted arabinose efflux permease, MFS family [Faunimonas pinastri]|uniref:Uncharacterized MFS-type transporter SAMN05216548_101103 n=1 Tax=Faunimonas pinastri TaxID=1855383 RepID=A0A1H8ZBG3_9HYPH|nr:MFS transporter [Faunimonas pinastri]SEP61775.1 Predicted arabinose efflux permease, MFS family [Faunimonas pinastri]
MKTARPSLASLLSVVGLTFLGYLAIGLPLAVLPGYVSEKLGFGVFWAGVAISTQYIATILSRAQVGQLIDVYGPKRSVVLGFLGYLSSGVLTLASVFVVGQPLLSLLLLLAGRLALGIGESWVSTAAITWAIGLLGPRETVRVISWNGIATYGGLALAAPIGAVLEARYGFGSIGICTFAIGVAGLLLTRGKPTIAAVAARSIGARKVIGLVAPYGVALALASSGFGVITAFIALYFGSRDWAGAPFALSAFGLAFIGVRLFLANSVSRFGGLPVARVSLAVEMVGLIALATAQRPEIAIIGAALAGAGFAPVFPALGGEAMSRTPPQNRGVALGIYSVFLDVALGATGPLAGLLASRFGYGSPFLLGVAAVLLSLAMSFGLRKGEEL